jgi:hypothetical protein
MYLFFPFIEIAPINKMSKGTWSENQNYFIGFTEYLHTKIHIIFIFLELTSVDLL